MTEKNANLATRLNLKAGMRVFLLNDRAGITDDLRAAVGAGLRTEPDGSAVDAVLFFAANSDELRAHSAQAAPALAAGAMLWILYPKKSAGVTTDLTRDEGWEAISAGGMQAVRQISVNDIWSAVRFKQVADANVRGSVDEQYGGARLHLRPIFDRLAQEISALGPNVSEPLVRGAYVVWSRKSHFVAVGPVGPVGRQAVGVSFKFGAEPFAGRFVASKRVGGGAFTHLITLASLDEIDAELLGYLRRAYTQSV